MVRKIAKARAMRSQLNEKQRNEAKAPAVRRPVHDNRDARRAREKEMAENAKKKKKLTPTSNLKKPLAARKSAAPVNHKVMRPSKQPSEEDSDEYSDGEFSQDEEEEPEEEEEEEEEESDGSQRRPTARNKAVEEIEESDEDSVSSGDSYEELDLGDASSRRHSPPRTKKVGGGIATRVTTQPVAKKKPLPKTSVLKPKPRPRTPPLPPPRRPSPSQASSAVSRPRTNEPAARSSRAVASLPENMSIEDMQAQERQLAYFKQLQKRKEQSSQQASSSAPRARTPLNNSNARSAVTASRARKPVTTQSVHRLSRKDSAASINSSAASSVASREPKPLARSAKAPPPYVPQALRDAYSSTGTRSVVTTVSVALDAATSFAAAEKVNHIPLPHNSWWRERLQFVRAPLNILPAEPHSCSWQAFSQVKERELCEFDDSGTIAPLADLATPPKVSTNELLTQSFQSQDHINQKVRRVIDKSLPVLKQCHRRRVQDIISEMRKSLPWAASHSRGGRSIQPSVEGSPGSDMAPIEHVQAKRILHASLPRAKTQQPNRLVGTIYYVLGYPRSRRTTSDADESLEDAVYELPHFPETIIEIGEELAPMRRACTWISVKTNVHVDDDPILRYIPYLGDKERVNIDPRRYNATTLDKERSIIVELPESDERRTVDGEEVVKTQERLDMWRNDVANLAYATRSATDDEVMEYLLCMVIKQCGRSDKVIQALREVGGFAEPITDYDVILKREDMARTIGKRLQDLHRCLDTENSNSNAFAPVRQYVSRLVRTSNVRADTESVNKKLRAPLGSFSSNYLEHPEAKGVRPRKSIGHVMEWYRDLFCRRCYTYDCPHGIQFPQPSRRTDPLNPVVKKSGVGLTRAKKASGNGEDDVIEIASSSSSEDSEGEEENEDVQSTLSGSVDGEADTAEGDGADRRRSGRSGTRASSMATASLKVQEVMVEKERRKLQRKQAKQLQKLVRQVDDSEYLDDSYRDIVGPVMDTLLSPEAESLCGACCWKRLAGTSHEISSPDLSEVTKLMLRKLLPILGDNACLIARLLQDPAPRKEHNYANSCAAIHRYIDEQKQKTGDTSNPSASSAHDGDHFHDKTGHRKQHQQNRSSAALHSGNRELIKRTRMNRAQQQTKEHEHRYEPCNHSGACDAGNCDCLKRGHDCDNACSCSRECVNRHHGCKCAPGQCRKKGCLCYDASRECDPDFCFLCGAHEAAVMAFDETQRFVSARDVGICQNVSLLRGVHKKIGVAFSATHGWGAYALEPIRKGEFVYEYTGALISDDEAERRGNIYDALNVSFLFNVNSDEVVDAMRKGNKIKFANHKTRELANLETKILVVRGEHRIALFAKWDLPLGEELFFDYGYTNETAPEWSQLRTPHNPRYTASDPDDDDDDDELEEVLRLQS